MFIAHNKEGGFVDLYTSQHQQANIINFKPIISNKARSIYAWIVVIIENNLPFTYVESESVRSMISTKIDTISRKTITKYINNLSMTVVDIIADQLPNVFCLIIDGWSDGNGTHYVGIYACYNNIEQNVAKMLMLALSPLEDETNFTAQNHVNFIIDTLNWYNKTLNNVCCLIGDNTNTNPAIANIIGIPLVGCASHKLNLYVKKVYYESENRLLSFIDNIRKVSKKLRNLKFEGQQRKLQMDQGLQPLKPVVDMVVRWTSTYSMITRYMELKPLISHIEFDGDDAEDLETAKNSIRVATYNIYKADLEFLNSAQTTSATVSNS